jgi:hypothetical protein
MTVNRSDFSRARKAVLSDTDLALVWDTDGDPGEPMAVELVTALSSRFASVEDVIDESTLTIDGDLLTRAGGVPAPITRANLAADPAFSALYVPKAGDRVWVDAPSLAAVFGSPTLTSALGSGAANDAAWSMADAGSRGVGGSVMLPDHWSTFKIELYHGNTTTTAGNVRWNVTAKYAGSGDVPYVGTGALTASDLTVAAPTTAGAIGVAQIPASSLSHTTGKPLFFAVARYGSDGADTLTNAALVYGVLFTRLT